MVQGKQNNIFRRQRLGGSVARGVVGSSLSSNTLGRRWPIRLPLVIVVLALILSILPFLFSSTTTLPSSKDGQTTVEHPLSALSKPKEKKRTTTTSTKKDAIASTVSNSAFNPQQQQQQQQILPPAKDDVDQQHTVAYAISLIKCGDKQSTPAGLTDAALVLRHSVHLQSRRNPASGSKYDYQMYALVHPQAMNCSHILQQVGFTIVTVPPPLQPSEIQGEFLKTHIHREWCCGSDEFIKLHAFLLPQPVVVHVDIDFAFLRPMDDLYDALLYDASTPIGQAARSRIPLEQKSTKTTPTFPTSGDIQAFVTRDWPQVVPGRKPGYQAGFIVARRNPQVQQEIVNVIKEGNYTPGFGRNSGWGGLGYGAFVGAMAMQGIMAYYYDVIRPNTAVELNQCRYNWMGMDVKYNAQPNFNSHHPKKGQCRNDGDYCEDCRKTPVDKVYNVHYTQCRKPWNCISVGYPGGHYPKRGKASAIDTNAGDLAACLVMIRKWHEFRADLEQKWYNITHDETILQGQSADYKRDLYHGHCRDDGGSNYNPIQAKPESFQHLAKLYQ